MTIKEVLATLSTDQTEKIMFAFNNCTPLYIELPGKLYIGVNVERISSLTEEERAGEWSYGRIN